MYIEKTLVWKCTALASESRKQDYFSLIHVTKASAKQELKMTNEDGFFRGAVLDLLLGEGNDQASDKIFDPFMEATVYKYLPFFA